MSWMMPSSIPVPVPIKVKLIGIRMRKNIAHVSIYVKT
jgi:hypothetical protein